MYAATFSPLFPGQRSHHNGEIEAGRLNTGQQPRAFPFLPLFVCWTVAPSTCIVTRCSLPCGLHGPPGGALHVESILLGKKPSNLRLSTSTYFSSYRLAWTDAVRSSPRERTSAVSMYIPYARFSICTVPFQVALAHPIVVDSARGLGWMRCTAHHEPLGHHHRLGGLPCLGHREARLDRRSDPWGVSSRSESPRASSSHKGQPVPMPASVWRNKETASLKIAQGCCGGETWSPHAVCTHPVGTPPSLLP